MNSLEELKTLKFLYIKKLLGDSYINRVCEPVFLESTFESPNLWQSTRYIHFSNLHTQVYNCKLCHLSHIMDQRFIQISPIDKPKISVAFILDSISLRDDSEKIDSLINNLVNQTVLDIIENIFNFRKNEVYIFTFFKCVGKSMDSKDKLSQACKIYLSYQLQHIRYAIFFSEVALNALMHYSLKEAKGKVLKYKDTKCMVSYDIESMIKNPTFKQEMLRNFAYFKKIIMLEFTQDKGY